MLKVLILQCIAIGGSLSVVPVNDIRGPAATATESPFGRAERIQRCKLASAARILDLHGFAAGIQALLTVRLRHLLFLLSSLSSSPTSRSTRAL